jgi:hypothetical protein
MKRLIWIGESNGLARAEPTSVNIPKKIIASFVVYT